MPLKHAIDSASVSNGVRPAPMLATPVTRPNGTRPTSGGSCARTPAKNRSRGESTRPGSVEAGEVRRALLEERGEGFLRLGGGKPLGERLRLRGERSLDLGHPGSPQQPLGEPQGRRRLGGELLRR